MELLKLNVRIQPVLRALRHIVDGEESDEENEGTDSVVLGMYRLERHVHPTRRLTRFSSRPRGRVWNKFKVRFEPNQPDTFPVA